jgi:V8-like Glu-specific endopeptidase
MMMTAKYLLALGAGLVAANAQATSYLARDFVQTRMTYSTAAAVSAAKTSGYSGVGSIFVAYESTATSGFGSLCTASMIRSNTALTAAHCIYDYDEAGNYDPVKEVFLIMPSFGDLLASTPATTVFSAIDWAYNPGYDKIDLDGSITGTIGTHYGDIVSGYDTGLLKLGVDVVGHQIYDLFLGNPLQQYTEVGTGTIGIGFGTYSGVPQDYLKRVGSNIFEFYGDEVFSDVSHGVVLSDFDDGTATHDVFGRVFGATQLGVTDEASSSVGDSGGPEFIDGKIAAVTSFGITGGVFQGYCGGTDAIDPYRYSDDGSAITNAPTTDLSLCTNSSYGELNGNTLVSYNMAFIRSYLGAVPEPATWAQMIAGFGLLGGVMRRKHRQLARMRA